MVLAFDDSVRRPTFKNGCVLAPILTKKHSNSTNLVFLAVLQTLHAGESTAGPLSGQRPAPVRVPAARRAQLQRVHVRQYAYW
jgi:hypothetical protein